MRRVTLGLVLLAAVACGSDSTAPAPPDLTGNWSGSFSTVSWTMSLNDAGESLSGTCVLSAAGGQLQGTVSGSHRHPNFALTINIPGYYSIGYAGLASTNALRGLITGSGFTGDSLVMTRQ